MIELPEAYTLANQLNQVFVGKTIISAAANTSPHGFAWYSGDPALYNEKLAGRKVTGTAAYGGRPEMHADGMIVSFFDGVRGRYLSAGEKRPDKHQLLLEFDDGSALCCTVQMYGGMMAFPDEPRDDFYYNVGREKPSPFSEAFGKAYFADYLRVSKNPSASRRCLPQNSVYPVLATEFCKIYCSTLVSIPNAKRRLCRILNGKPYIMPLYPH